MKASLLRWKSIGSNDELDLELAVSQNLGRNYHGWSLAKSTIGAAEKTYHSGFVVSQKARWHITQQSTFLPPTVAMQLEAWLFEGIYVTFGFVLDQTRDVLDLRLVWHLRLILESLSTDLRTTRR